MEEIFKHNRNISTYVEKWKNSHSKTDPLIIKWIGHIEKKKPRSMAELSGARGIPDKHIKKAISLGITKINIDTDIRLAFTSTIREILAMSPKQFDPRKILGPAKEAMKEVVKSKIHLFGSSFKAP